MRRATGSGGPAIANDAWYAARGFVPREPIDELLGAEHVAERRCWLGAPPPEG